MYKVRCVSTKNEESQQIEDEIRRMDLEEGYDFVSMTSVHLYTDFDNDDYFNHYLIFKEHQRNF